MAFDYLPLFFNSWLLLYLLLGYGIGFFFGAVPGLTATLAIAREVAQQLGVSEG